MSNFKTLIGSFIILALILSTFGLGSFYVPFAKADIASGLVGHWTFDEGSGSTALDSSGNNSSGTISGPSWATGRIGSALSFDGSNDYVRVPYKSNLQLYNSSFTFSSWIKSTDSDEGMIVVRDSGNNTYNEWYFGLNHNNLNGNLSIWDGSNWHATSSANVNDGGWHMATITYDGSVIRMYKDGNLVATTSSVTTNYSSTDDIYIGGRNPALPRYFNGVIDDVRVYNRALSASDISELFVAAGTPPGDSTTPTVSITSPTTGAVVSGSSVVVSANATDNTGVAGVQFKLNGSNIGSEDTSSPYAINWDTTTVLNGSHSLTAVARDAAGNTVTSIAVNVNVSNTITPPPPPSSGGIVNALSCQLSAVQTAVNSAVDGNTVVVPAGNCTWSSGLGVSNKSITLQGAGVGSTIITDGISGAKSPLLSWNVKSSGVTRLTGFTFDGGNTGFSTGSEIGILTFNGSSANLRVDNIKINVRIQGHRGMFFHGNIRGVVDTMTCESYTFAQCTHIGHETWGDVSDQGCYGSCGGQSWVSPSSIGTSEALYFENSTFEDKTGNIQSAGNSGAHDGEYGMRVVFRKNTYINTFIGNHGLETGGRTRGARQWEYYDNTFIYNDSRLYFDGAMGSRGGTGIVFNNKAVISGGQGLNSMFNMSTYRANTPGASYHFWGFCGIRNISNISVSGTTATVTTSSPHGILPSGAYMQISGVSPAGYNGSFWVSVINGTNFSYSVPSGLGTPSGSNMTYRSPFDGNQNSTGYRCADQIGAGSGNVLLTGNYPPYAPFASPITSLNQVLEPVYIFNNTKSGVVLDSQVRGSGNVFQVIVKNRDYYDQAPSFNGTVGVGVGPIASRPFTCTAGVGYWATNEGNWDSTNGSTPDGRLYKCTSTNNWSVYYTPYTYPHPLRSGSAITPNPTPPPPGPNPPPPSSKFVIGDRVVAVPGGVLARSAPSFSGSELYQHPEGTLGTVTAGPQIADGYTWWNVDYDTNVDGWSTETNIDKYTAPSTISKNLTIDLEGRTDRTISGTLEVLNSSKNLIKSYPFTTNSSGTVSLNLDQTSGSLFFKLKASPYLSRLLSGDINTTLAFPQLKTGDINQDNIVNSIDFSTLNTNWFTTHQTSDLNRDTIVNSLDFSLMNRNWFVRGEE